MEALFSAVEKSSEYPRTLLRQKHFAHVLDSYAEMFDDREDVLFDDEDEAELDFWEASEGPARVLECKRIRNSAELQKSLRVSTKPSRPDPKCRYIFICAPDSRSRLLVTRKMMSSMLTYHQVMPSFLDHLFCYGERIFDQDCHFSGLHFEPRLTETHADLCVPELNRSGRSFQICYSLCSPEQAKRQKNWPWSIRSATFYHSFDVVSGLSNWIVVKGSESMKNRMISELDPSNTDQQHAFTKLEEAFTYALSSHLIPCDWAGENWRWYINYMEEAIQRITRRTLTVTVTDDSSNSANFEKRPIPQLDNFSFTDLQEIQHIEEKANAALLVLKLNTKVLQTLSKTYESIVQSEESPGTLKGEICRREFLQFSAQISNIVNDLQIQQSRVQTLVRLLSDRKALLYGILEYRSMEASKTLAEKAQLSAVHMEDMTIDMHDIARKTKQEAVSMRIITLVTLFFLPGTFISTLMSTDIVQWQISQDGKQTRVVSIEAIETFLAASLPLMFLTFCAWYAVYRWLDWRQKIPRRRSSTSLV